MTGLVLVLAIPALAAAAAIPDVSDTRAGAQAIETLPARASELVERVGDQDWYSIIGRNADDSVNSVFVRVLRNAPTCSTPLRIALFNPEGRWMRSIQASSANVATMLVPGLPSRYTLDVSALEPGCAGLEYEVTAVTTERPTPDNAAGRCLIARAGRLDAQERLRVLEIRRGGFKPAARKRYDGYIAKAKRAVTRARRAEKRACA